MKSCRVHLMGASGTGVTTLGRALADALAIPHHDTDDYFWQPTVPPYQNKRERAERLRLMQEVFLPRADWVLSGALDGWRHHETEEFVEWASHYDDGNREGRSLAKHEAWLAACPARSCASMDRGRYPNSSRKSVARSIQKCCGRTDGPA